MKTRATWKNLVVQQASSRRLEDWRTLRRRFLIRDNGKSAQGSNSDDNKHAHL
jgi:hypothetical protein